MSAADVCCLNQQLVVKLSSETYYVNVIVSQFGPLSRKGPSMMRNMTRDLTHSLDIDNYSHCGNLVCPKQHMELQDFHPTAALSNRSKIKAIWGT